MTTTHAAATRPGRIDSIQGLRGIAALLVVVDHSLLTLVGGSPGAQGVVRLAEALGRYGVEIFFLISGFIMTSTMLNDFGRRNASVDFLWKRLIRIAPLYWMVTVVVILRAVYYGDPPELSNVARSLLFIPYVDDAGLFQPILRRGWTLNYEMFFYALFAAALLLPRRPGIANILAVLPIIVIVAHIGSGGSSVLAFYGQGIVLFFAGGILLAVIRAQLEKSHRLRSVSLGGCIAAAMAATAFYGALLLFFPESPATAAAGPVIAVGVIALCSLVHDDGSHTPIRLVILVIGDASYSIYLMHGFVIDPSGHAWIAQFGRHGMIPFTGLMLIVTSLLGVLTFMYIERPTLRTLRKLRRAPAAT